ncbi:hypothetical protein BDA99DRAFT_535977 [Phascolomyces articulosus]|uniref:Uncharacterized protein n=1 Tax=Phascolomyces articulosus TaxID=60185 RepID=A0AAD5KCC0_9FUNG|nr:hypothetical protein BDA99DRAFT_535977 [Phascolomyces articulosus]
MEIKNGVPNKDLDFIISREMGCNNLTSRPAGQKYADSTQINRLASYSCRRLDNSVIRSEYSYNKSDNETEKYYDDDDNNYTFFGFGSFTIVVIVTVKILYTKEFIAKKVM